MSIDREVKKTIPGVFKSCHGHFRTGEYDEKRAGTTGISLWCQTV